MKHLLIIFSLLFSLSNTNASEKHNLPIIGKTEVYMGDRMSRTTYGQVYKLLDTAL